MYRTYTTFSFKSKSVTVERICIRNVFFLNGTTCMFANYYDDIGIFQNNA